jgi:hypothetical protein
MNEYHMVEQIDRLEAKHEGRISVLLEHSRGEEHGLEAMRSPCTHDTAKAAHGLAAFFSVVGKRVEPPLHRLRRSQPLDQAMLGRSERGCANIPVLQENGR